MSLFENLNKCVTLDLLQNAVCWIWKLEGEIKRVVGVIFVLAAHL